MQLWRNRQTRYFEGVVRTLSYGFKSHQLHQSGKSYPTTDSFFYFLMGLDALTKMTSKKGLHFLKESVIITTFNEKGGGLCRKTG